jgi:hypothetical protein
MIYSAHLTEWIITTANTVARHSFQPGHLHLIFNFNDISMPEFNFNQAVLISAGLA